MLKTALRNRRQRPEWHSVFGLMEKFHNIPYANRAAKSLVLRHPSPVPNSMIPKSGNRFSEKDHAQTKR